MANGLGSFSIGMDPRPFLAQRGMQIQNRRIVPIPGFSQPAMPTPPPVAQPVAQPTQQPVAPPMIPELPPALPSEQLNMQPPVPPMQEPPPMAPPMAPPVMDQSDNDSVRGFFGRLRDSGFTFPERPIASPSDNMMQPTPLLPPPPPPRFGLPDGLDGIGFDRFLERFSPPRFGLNRIAPMPRFSPFDGPRRQG